MTIKISGGTGITYPDDSVATSAPANFVQEDEPHADLVQPYMTWADTANMLLKRRNAANTAWVTLGPLLDYYYTRGNILGIVSQSGGVPTGAIIERGSNANGEFVKWADGTCICHARKPFTMSVTSANGAWFSFTLPISFVEGSESGSLEVTPTAHNSFEVRGTAVHEGSIVQRRIVNTSAEQDAIALIHVIGRWY